MDGIHFNPLVETKGYKVRVQTVDKDFPYTYLSLVTFTRLELNLALEVHVPRTEHSLIDVGIKRADGDVEFGMVAYDLVRRLPLADQRGDYLVNLVKLVLCKRDAGTGADKLLAVFAVGKLSIIMILLCDGAFMPELGTPVTYIRGVGETVALFLLEL